MALMPNVSDELKDAILDVLISKVEFYAMLKANPVVAQEWQRKRDELLQFVTIEKAPF